MKKKIWTSIGLVLGLIISYLTLLVYPNPLFAYHYEYQNFKIHSDKFIPSEIELVLEDVEKRLMHSELYEKEDKFNIYLCHKNWRFFLFTRNKNAGGVVNFSISPNVFIRESNIKENKLIPPSDWMYTPKERPLSYFIAHEITHSLQRKIDPFLNLKVPSYILEGYADYIGKRPDFNYEEYRDLYLKNDFVMNPQNGLYHKYHLYMAYLMEFEKRSFLEVLKLKPNLEATLDKIQ